MSPTHHQFLKYVAVGVGSFVIDYGGFAILHIFFGIWYIAAAALSQLCALVFNFTLNRQWTFDAHADETSGQLKRYIILQILNYTFSLTLLYFLVHKANLQPLIAKFATLGCIVLWNFLAYKHFVYKIKTPKVS